MGKDIFQGTIDHAGFVVPDIDKAVDFFTNILNFKVLLRPARMDPNDGSLKRYFGVSGDAVMEGAAFLEYGDKKIELVQWSDLKQKDSQPSPSDIGSAHLAISVTDLKEAYKYFEKQAEISVREITPLGFFYITTPWGMEIQIMKQQ